MSMKPGATTQPVASSSRAPCRSGPIAPIAPSEIATSAARPGAPEPSWTVPPRITRSFIGCRSQLVPHEGAGRLRPHPRGRAAVDGQHDTGDLRGAVAREEHGGVGDVL